MTTKEDTSLLNAAYSNVIKEMINCSSLNQSLCNVYEAVENLPPTKRIIPILKCLERLTPEVINEDALKTTQRLLIAIANLDFDKTSAGRTTPYTEEVFCFLHRLTSIFPQLVERNNKSLTKITECSLNHLLFLLNHKRTDEFEFSKEVLALLMQRIGLANNGRKLLLSIIHLLKSDLRDLKATDVYFGYFQKQNKSLKNNAIVVLWSLIGYLMENVGRNEDLSIPLHDFLTALKLTYNSNVPALQSACSSQLATLLTNTESKFYHMMPQICDQLELDDNNPMISSAQKAIFASFVDFSNKEEASQTLQTLCMNVDELLKDEQRLRSLNKFLASPEVGQPLPVEFAIGTLLQHPRVLNRSLPPKVTKEVELCRKLCANLLQCRKALIGNQDGVNGNQKPTEMKDKINISGDKSNIQSATTSKSTRNKRPATPPLLITLDDSTDDLDSQESKKSAKTIVRSLTETPAKTHVNTSNPTPANTPINTPSKTPVNAPVNTPSKTPVNTPSTTQPKNTTPSSSKTVANINSSTSKTTEQSQSDEPQSKRQRRVSFSQIDYAQIYASDSQLQQYEENEEEQASSRSIIQASVQSTEPDQSLSRLFSVDASKPSAAENSDETENLVDLF